MRTLLIEAETIEPLSESPGQFGDPIGEGETVVGTVPLDVRQVITLAHRLAERNAQVGSTYEQRNDPDGSILAEIYERQAQISMLEACAIDSILALYVRQVGCTGDLIIRTGWQVTWTPIEEECDCDECEGETEDTKRGLDS